ncbi:MAG: DUF2314 domain-containing protein [Myxococcota bacterium]|nr:DUF2314 domain-containing protein [Myxococcota bacterium]
MRPASRAWVVTLLAGVVLVAGLRAAAELEPAPRGDLRDAHVVLQFAVYLLEPTEKDLSARAEALRAARFAFLKPSVKLSEDMELPALVVSTPPIAEYAPPDRELLGYFGKGLSDEQKLAASKSERVVVLTFAAERATATRVHAAAMALAAELATELGGLVWDDATRLLHSVDDWKQRAVFAPDAPVDVRYHVTMHAYRDGELIRIITLGMEKFGLPDVAVNDVPAGSSRSMGNLVNLVCQTLVEGGTFAKEGRLPVDIVALRNPAMRESQAESPGSGATGKAELVLRWIEPDEGDPENRILELAFKGPASQVAQEAVLSQVYGGDDEIVYVDHDDRELQAASERARKRLLSFRPKVSGGYGVGERLLVKGPFATPDGGAEWMWVEVVRWEGDRLEGILDNDPFNVPGLKAGARVHVQVDDVFDYLFYHQDGRVEGNETAAIIQRMHSSGP